MCPCVNFLVCLVVLKVLYFSVHDLNPVGREFLNLWKKTFGMLKFLGENSTVSEIRYTLVLGMYALWNM